MGCVQVSRGALENVYLFLLPMLCAIHTRPQRLTQLPVLYNTCNKLHFYGPSTELRVEHGSIASTPISLYRLMCLTPVVR